MRPNPLRCTPTTESIPCNTIPRIKRKGFDLSITLVVYISLFVSPPLSARHNGIMSTVCLWTDAMEHDVFTFYAWGGLLFGFPYGSMGTVSVVTLSDVAQTGR